MKKISKKTYFLAAVLSSLVMPALAAQAEEHLTGVKAESKAALLETEADFDQGL